MGGRPSGATRRRFSPRLVWAWAISPSWVNRWLKSPQNRPLYLPWAREGGRRRAGRAPRPVAAPRVADPVRRPAIVRGVWVAAPAYWDDLVYYEAHRVRAAAARPRVCDYPEAIVDRPAANRAVVAAGAYPRADPIPGGSVGAPGVLPACRGESPPKRKRPRLGAVGLCSRVCVSPGAGGLLRSAAAFCGFFCGGASSNENAAGFVSPAALCIKSRISVYSPRGACPPFNPPLPVGAQSTT